MKYTLYFFCIILFGCYLTACDSNTIQSETSDTELPTRTDSLAGLLSTYDKNVQSLIQDPNGLVKGFTLGMEGTVVKSKNSNLQVVDSINNTYSIQLDPVEAADYSFQIADDKLNKIEVIIYPENEYRQGIYYRELKDYYSSKFNTKATEDENTLTWRIPSQELSIHLSKVGNRKIHDLQLTFEKLK
jgi:hypothetical protein